MWTRIKDEDPPEEGHYLVCTTFMVPTSVCRKTLYRVASFLGSVNNDMHGEWIYNSMPLYDDSQYQTKHYWQELEAEPPGE